MGRILEERFMFFLALWQVSAFQTVFAKHFSVKKGTSDQISLGQMTSLEVRFCSFSFSVLIRERYVEIHLTKCDD